MTGAPEGRAAGRDGPGRPGGRVGVTRGGLAARLLGAAVAVGLLAAVTGWAVAAAVGPGIFHDHMMMAGVEEPAVVLHAEQAFRSASALSLTLALLAALLAAATAALFLTRRLTRTIGLATTAVRRVAVGDHSVRVAPLGLGRELDEMTAAFNAMAADLGDVEASRTRMLGDLAHEMRTPVATLDAYLEAIVDGVQPADPDTLAMLRGQVGRLARLAEDVALVTTAEEGRLSMRLAPVVVGGALDDAHAQAAVRYAEQGVALEVRASAGARAAVVTADGARLGQVLTNLLDNALRHTPAGGRVVLSAEVQEGTEVRGVVVLTVADDGDGIPAEHLPHVFERFYRVDSARDRRHGGSGVGLAIVRAIVEAFGGSVSAASAGPGQGATLTVTLPLAGVSPR